MKDVVIMFGCEKELNHWEKNSVSEYQTVTQSIIGAIKKGGNRDDH
jgi:hypothetical protein